ncbi:TetR/AcrR family transcriptional regulator [Streptacidiphilus sp. PB12-B1b]|uniref:TetR/AcrR family transcriptional regulator n=1 Tax=Streptacidiphilus sp. PB12-B1b TaxID=2705012 RepID=UPI0015F86548|nr:TetR/AcrR family transcriptional regulator [Streptacidiphilus sp. PB12-B1b]QMU76689.1 TetR/AcrR family transcriptional regulator [Streptacidiphilus sp. PB12-B1b]
MSTEAPEPGGRPTRGRPRSTDSELAILQAALDLLAEGTELGDISINAIAARAGAGKNTVYRRWPNKDALLVDALASLNRPVPAVTGANTRERMILVLSALVTRLQDVRATQIINGVMAAGLKYPQLRERYYADVIEPRREAMRQVVRAGIASGELRPDVDPDAIGNMLSGPLITRSIESSVPQGPAEEIAAELVDVILFGISRTPR